jgi:predicted transcriptional regulator
MKRSLLEVIFASEKRKKVLLLLRDGAQEMEHLLRSLDTTRQALLPQIKLLEEHYLISHQRDTYRLTTIGELIVDKMTPLVSTNEVLDIDISYWGTHKLDFLPSHLYERIADLGRCTVINPPLPEMYELNRYFHEATKKSRSTTIVTTIVHPDFPDLFSEMLQNRVEVYDLLDNNLYERVTADHYDEMVKIISNKSVHMFVYPKEMGLVYFTYNDYMLMLCLLTDKGEFDSKHVISTTPSALKWAKELFEYYLKDSTPITGI